MTTEHAPKGKTVESALIESIRRGERHAAVVLNQRLKRKLSGYVRGKIGARLGARLDADDILQETYSEVVQYIRKGSGVRDLDALCRAIARNLIARQARKKSLLFQRLPSHSSSRGGAEVRGRKAAAQGPHVDLLRRERADVIESALQSLSPQQARIIRLRFFSHGGDRRMTFREIGTILGMRPEAAEKAYQRAKKKLQEYLARRLSHSTLSGR